MDIDDVRTTWEEFVDALRDASGADAEASHQADKLFRSMKPVQKRRDRYDEEYDMGKVKKVKAKVKAGRKRLGNQSSAFQRAAKGKFDARSRRKNSSHH